MELAVERGVKGGMSSSHKIYWQTIFQTIINISATRMAKGTGGWKESHLFHLLKRKWEKGESNSRYILIPCLVHQNPDFRKMEGNSISISQKTYPKQGKPSAFARS